MTGFGRAVVDGVAGSVSVEIRAVNHRFLDVRVRLPAGMLALEDGVRRAIGDRLHRGRVECTIALDETGSGRHSLRVDEALLESAAAGLKQIRERLGIVDPPRVADVVAIPQLWRLEAAPLDEAALEATVTQAVTEALDSLVAMRQKEGRALAEDVEPRIDRIVALAEELARRAPIIVADAQQRLTQRIQQLLADQPVDPARLAQEAAMLADRADVSEELTRIASHLGQVRAHLREGGPVGRTLDFLLQELNREWNTIGSKIHDADGAVLVVQARAELEKIREQVQNIQ